MQLLTTVACPALPVPGLTVSEPLEEEVDTEEVVDPEEELEPLKELVVPVGPVPGGGL